MSVRPFICSVAVCGVALVLNAPAFANGCDSNGNGKHNGYECEDPAPPAPPPPTSDTPDPPAPDPQLPSSEQLASDPPATESDSPAPPPAASDDTRPETAPPDAPSSPPAAAPSPAPASPPPPAVIDGWGPVGTADTAPPSHASSGGGGRVAPAGPRPNASWADRDRDASWSNSVADYGVTGTSAIITVRQRHGVVGGLSFRVELAPGQTSFVFRAARSVVAGGGGRLYRVGTWLRTDAPGLTVCLRIQEVAAADPLTSVRTSEACVSPTAKWRHFKLYRRTLAPGNRLVFSIYSYGAVSGDSFEVDRFRVDRRVGRRLWKRVAAAFSNPV